MPCQRAISPVWERLPPRFTSPSSWFSWWSSDSFVFGAGQTVARVMLINHEPKLLYPIGWTHCVSYLWHSKVRAVASVLSICWRITHSLICCWSAQALVHHHLLLAGAIHFSVIWDWLSPLRTPSHFLSKLWSMCVELYLVHYGGWCFLKRLLKLNVIGQVTHGQEGWTRQWLTNPDRIFSCHLGGGGGGALCGAFKVQQLVQLIMTPLSQGLQWNLS